MALTKNNNLPPRAASPSNSSIKYFYRDKSVLITGGTGFVGRFLILRLLQTCPVKNIYVLVRGKRGLSYMERFEKFISGEIFSHLPTKKLIEKVIPIEGDITIPGLCCNSQDLDMLVDKVHVVFHSAASIRFNDPLKASTRLHVQGTENVVKLCKKMVNIKAYVHVSSVSTFYPEEVVKDEVVNFPFFPKAFIKVMEEMDETQAEKITPSVLGKYPNTYTFTKTMAEVLIKEEIKDGLDIPVAIARPPFVFPAYKVPECGWFDSVQTLPSLVTLFSAGVVRTIGFHPLNKAEYMPVDMLANSLIAMAWFMDSDRCNDSLMTFNMCSSLENPITIEDFSRIASEVGESYPSIRALRPPKPTITYLPNKLEYALRKLISHTMFAYLVDSLLFVAGKKPALVKLTAQINDSLTFAVDKFYKKDLTVEMKNMNALIHEVSSEEKHLFFFDIRDVDWRKLIVDHHMRFRRHVLKEPDDNIPAAVARMKKVKICYAAFKLFVGALAVFMPLAIGRFLYATITT